MPDDRELLQQALRALLRSEGNYLGLRMRVLTIHRPCTSVPPEEGGCSPDKHCGNEDDDTVVCWNCVEPWPCATARAAGVS